MKKREFLLLSIVISIFLMAGWVYSDTFTVTNLNDSGDGSLRWAIDQANINPGPDAITFNISGTISVLSSLPPITDDGTVIDASSQWIGVWPDGQPGITLDGSTAGNAEGLAIVHAHNCYIRGLFIRNFSYDGIVMRSEAQFNTIGGTGVGYRNVISGNSERGVAIHDQGTNNNVVTGNYIGTDIDGMAPLGNLAAGVGIYGSAQSNIIGGAGVGEGNIIAFSSPDGINVDGTDTDYNKISGNSIHDNGDLGIELSDGGNNEIPAPAFTSAVLISNTLHVEGIGAGTDATVEIFEADTHESGEGMSFLGSLTADGSGHFSGSLDMTGKDYLEGDPLVATTTHTNNNTSEFSIYLITTIYVDVNNTTGVEDGSQANPFSSITAAIASADDGNMLLVASGIYDENPHINGITLNLFGGYENVGWTRDIDAHETIIDGGGRNSTVQLDGGNTVVDGFTIINGQAPNHGGGGLDTHGGNYIIRNCKIHGNAGIGDDEWGAGGVIFGGGGYIEILNCEIFDNHSPYGAAALLVGDSNVSVRNSLIYSNTGTRSLHIQSSTGEFINCTIADHESKAVGSNPGPIQFRNCILWNNGGGQWDGWATFAYSDVEEDIAGGGNIRSNPFFVDPNSGDFHLQLGSPCIDAGDPDPGYNDVDGSRSDMGAYGGPSGESYTYEDGPPIVEQATATPGFILVGNPVNLQATVYDAVGSVTSVQAEIESPDETVFTILDLYDDGSHNDGGSGDDIYGNTWTTPADAGRHYFIDIHATDNNSNMSIYDNISEFDTHEPVTIHVDVNNTTGVEDGSQANPYNTIDEGMNAAQSGDTVMVMQGTYEEEVGLKTDVVLMGEGPNVTIIWGNPFAEDITGAKIIGFKIEDDNTAGIHLYNSQVEVRNCVVLNQPHNGIHCSNTELTAINNVFIHNGHNGILFIDGSTGTLFNNIIVCNDNRGINGGGAESLTINYNNVWGNGGGNYSGNASPGPDDISVNPLFVNLDNDFHLQLGSPCINAGDPDPSYNDVDGSRNDMGAYGGPSGESYTYEDGPPVAEDMVIAPTLVQFGTDVLITCYVWDAVSSVGSVQAEIENPDETVVAIIDLYDDGSHNDGGAGDGIYGNSWTTPSGGDEAVHFVDIIASDDQSHTGHYDNMGEFFVGDLIFTKITTGEIVNDGGTTMGGIWGDYDNDGHVDLFVANSGSENNVLYRNNGDGTFTKVTSGPVVSDGVSSSSGSWGDYDNDGHLDLYVTTYNENLLYTNNGGGTFTQVTTGAIVTDVGNSYGCCWGDYDNDGYLDMFVANTDQNFLYLNKGDGTFTKITEGVAVTDDGYSLGCSWADIDNDGDLDLLVVNANGEDNFLYTNNGDSTFTKVTTGPVVSDGGNSRSCSWGDFDNDGDLDLFVSNYNDSNCLYTNDGNGNFTKVTSGTIVDDGPARSRSSGWCDYDNDGDLDLFVANDNQNNALYTNEGSGVFTKAVNEIVVSDRGRSRSCAWCDYDNDGDMDIFVGNYTENNFLYANRGNDNGWINVTCVGSLSNASAIGTKVRVKATIGGSSVWQMNEISAKTGGYGAQNSLNAEFGLGDATTIEMVKTEWPSGTVQVFTNVTPNQFLTITEALEEVTSTGSDVEVTFENAASLNFSSVSSEGTTTLTMSETGPSAPSWYHILPLNYPLYYDFSTTAEYTSPVTIQIGYDDTELGGFNEENLRLLHYDNGQFVDITVSVDTDQNVITGETMSLSIFGLYVFLTDQPVEAIEALITIVENLDLHDGTENSLISKLDNAIKSLQKGHHDAAVNQLNAFINHVQAQSGKKISEGDADNLIFYAQSIIDAIQSGIGKRAVELDQETDNLDIPEEFALHQNYPNPFNPETRIRYALPEDGRVTLVVYNMMGQEVRRLVDADQSAGYYDVVWDGCGDNGNRLGSGVYFVHFRARDHHSIRKLILIQ